MEIKSKMAEFLEIMLIVSFGASWPLNVIKSYRARTTKGKSLSFLYLIFFGYIAGKASKFVNSSYMEQIAVKLSTGEHEFTRINGSFDEYINEEFQFEEIK